MAKPDGKNKSNTYKYAHRYGAGKGWRDRNKSEEYLNNFEKAFGKRCIKHCQEALPCLRCKELAK